MRYVGIDIGSEKHAVTVVDGEGAVLSKARAFTEDRAGYEALFSALGEATDTLVVMEATGHYWQNLYAELVTKGFAVVLANPIQTRRFADGELARTKTDNIEATRR